MALPASGTISLSQVNVELGVSATATRSLNDSTTRTLFGKASGQISLSDGYGKANEFAFTIASNQTNANLRTLAVNAGWNQSSKVVATINSGVYISSNSTGTPALTINGSFPGGVQLTNNGIIVGMGGNGGAGGGASTNGVAGGTGGTALLASVGITINNAGTIAGGGGGGGGGACGSEAFDDFGTTLYGTGGGGGGGRSSSAANSSGGGTGGGSGPQNVYGASGGAGTVSSEGSGGLGGQYFSQARLGGNGGNGGGWGAGGSAGTSGRAPLNSPGGGGSGGNAISGNSNVTWTATGTRLGSIG